MVVILIARCIWVVIAQSDLTIEHAARGIHTINSDGFGRKRRIAALSLVLFQTMLCHMPSVRWLDQIDRPVPFFKPVFNPFLSHVLSGLPSSAHALEKRHLSLTQLVCVAYIDVVT